MSKQPTLWQRVRALPTKIKSWWGPEGSYRDAWGMSELGGWFKLDPLDGTGWQRNLDVPRGALEHFGPVYACVATIAQDLSRIPILHQRTMPDGNRELVTNKAPHRIFRSPNRYQTRSDWILYMVRSLLLDGNAYAVATRNDRFEVENLCPISPRQMWPYIHEGEIFYRFGGDEVIHDLTTLDPDEWFPQRDVLHVKLFCPRHPMVGESPITAATAAAITGVQINMHNAAFFANMSRPSGVLRFPGKLGTTAPLQEAAIKRIKDHFMSITQRRHTGEPIVLQDNGQWQPMTMSAVDSDIVRSYAMTVEEVARVFRVPQPLLGHLEKATFQNVESLLRFYTGSCLSFYSNHFEEAFSKFFNLPPDERIHFDIETAMLRADLRERADALAAFVRSGILAPNEARAREGLPSVEYGDEPRVQQQLVPLSFGADMQPGGGVAPTPAPAAEEPEPTEEQELAAAIIARRAIEKAMETAQL